MRRRGEIVRVPDGEGGYRLTTLGQWEDRFVDDCQKLAELLASSWRDWIRNMDKYLSSPFPEDDGDEAGVCRTLAGVAPPYDAD